MKRSLGAVRAFTLIELLVVVAIISILASIAVPNLTDAMIRAKVARIKADARTLMNGVEMYMVDHNAYPMRHSPPAWQLPHLGTQAYQMGAVTTPISYLTSLPPDIFAKNYQWPNNGIDYWDPRQTQQFLAPRYGLAGDRWEHAPDFGYTLVSVGPDGAIGAPVQAYLDYPRQGEAIRTLYMVYDPTNGTVSIGNIFRFQGDRDPAQILSGKKFR